MLRNLRKMLAVLVAVVLLLQCLPVAALGEIIKNSQSVQLFELGDAENTTTNYLTYTFYGEDGAKLSSQIVKQGDTLYAPASPEKDGYKFVGWSANATDENPVIFDGFGTVGEISATAEIELSPVFREVHYVFFLDGTGVDARVIATKEGIEGEEITCDVTFPVEADEGITGWYTETTLTNKVETLTLGASNVMLYPKTEK